MNINSVFPYRLIFLFGILFIPQISFAQQEGGSGAVAKAIKEAQEQLRLMEIEREIYLKRKEIIDLETKLEIDGAPIIPTDHVEIPNTSNNDITGHQKTKTEVTNLSSQEDELKNDEGLYFNLSSYYYEEPGLMKVKGFPLPMFGIGYRDFRAMNNSDEENFGLFSYYVEGFVGNVNYTSTNTGKVDYPQYKIQAEGLVSLPRNTFIGIGYRWLYSDLRKKTTTTGHWTYDRESNYLYVPLGFSQGAFQFQYNHLIEGKQISYLTDGGLSRDSINKQKNGYGWQIKLDPFYLRYWSIADSELDCFSGTCWIEPRNETFEFGFQVTY